MIDSQIATWPALKSTSFSGRSFDPVNFLKNYFVFSNTPNCTETIAPIPINGDIVPIK